MKLDIALGFIGTGEADVKHNFIGFVGVVFVLDVGNLKTITGLLEVLAAILVVVVMVAAPEDIPNTEHLVGLVVVVVPSNDNFFTNTILGAALAFGEDCMTGGGPV